MFFPLFFYILKVPYFSHFAEGFFKEFFPHLLNL